ncbi:MAG TPA: hypothetical protein VI461_10090 [Chitinophagaceae bacterium]|nr:hypothetical protein [Chitinophagaceae bacterium]
MFLNIVTDEELLTSQIVKTILLILLGVGIINTFFMIKRTGSKTVKTVNLIILPVLVFLLFFVLKEFRFEAALLKYPAYVQGTTVGYCDDFARGQGIEFEYEVNGQKYRNCDSFHPVSKDSVVVPGGKYFVRYSKKYPGEGRMNFQIPVK